MFYVDYRPKALGRTHTTIIVLGAAYLEYSDYGYERTVGYDEVVWC